MLTLKSQAKINLTLQVLNKRSDGYHNLSSHMHAIALHDTLTFSLASSDSLTTTDPTLPTDDSNLILKAAKLFRRATSLPLFIQCHLVKRIPHEAGLGGGSSNAATTLKALNHLANHPLSHQQLLDLAATLGSDVPFFLSSGSALCEGRGEILTPLPLLDHAVTLIKPPFGLSTPKVFQALQLPAPPIPNQLETPAFKIEPRLLALKNELLQHHANVQMSGSGTAFIAWPPNLNYQTNLWSWTGPLAPIGAPVLHSMA